MKKTNLVLLSTVFLIVASVFGVSASGGNETVRCGNYTFTFNMTEPYIIDNTSDIEPFIKTFDGKVYFSEWSMSYDELEDFIYLGEIQKTISGEGVVSGRIYKWPDTEFRLQFVLPYLYIQSTLNLTRSIDFFRDIEIVRITDEK